MKVFDAYAAYYDLIYRDKDYAGEAEYVMKLIRKFKPDAKTILDLGCGTGKHDLCFAGENFEVTGVELSENMTIAANKCLQSDTVANLKLKFIKGDIRSIRLAEKFDAITSLFHVLNYQTTNEDLRATLRTIKDHLKDDGKFICDFWYGPAVLNDRPEERIKKIKNNEYELERLAIPEMLVNENIVNVHYKIFVREFKSGEAKEINETHRMRYFFLPEIELLLSELDMKTEHFEEWMTGNVLSDKSWFALAVIGNK